MSERDEIEAALAPTGDPDLIVERYPAATVDILIALFAKKPGLANALLPEDYKVALVLEKDKKKTVIYRDSMKGRIISKKEAEANPDTTEREEIKRD